MTLEKIAKYPIFFSFSYKAGDINFHSSLARKGRLKAKPTRKQILKFTVITSKTLIEERFCGIPCCLVMFKTAS